jgi:hypothetical protein
VNIFEQATRQALRFASSKGELSTEQLWDLPLQSRAGFDLDSIAKSVNAALKESAEESFVSVATPANAILALKLEILKHIIGVKLAEQAEARNAAARAEQKRRLTEILGEKQDAALKDLSAEELQKRIAELG